MALLGLIMCSGYRHDRARDAENNNYNPLNSGSWEIAGIEKLLIPAISAAIAPELDVLMTIDEALKAWWET